MMSALGRVLLIGASGQLGHALEKRFSNSSLTTASYRHVRTGDLKVDLGDFLKESFNLK